MKIFKIKFDSKMPTTRKVTVGKDDDFGLAIQIDDLQTQGPAKLLYAGQEVEANKDLIEGYNVFLLKAVKDSTIAIKDVDSQVTFQVDISIKNTDVVELGGAGGGDAVWEFDGNGTYSIPGVLSVNGCDGVIKNNLNTVFLTDANGQSNIGISQNLVSLSSAIMCVDANQAIDMRTCGQVYISAKEACIEAPCDMCIKVGQLRIYDDSWNETLNIGSDQTFGNSSKSTTIKGNGITVCTTSSGITLNATGSNGLCMNASCITMKFGCGWQVFSATPSNQCIAFGNCSRTLELDASDMLLYSPNGHLRFNIRDFSINGYCCDENYYSYCHYGYYCQNVPNFNFPYGTITVAGNKNTAMGLRTKTLAIVLSAVECALLPGNHYSKEFDTESTTAFNKLTSIFSA